MLLPLLFTLDKLISHGYLEEVISSDDGRFISKLMTYLTSEVNGCSDVKRLLAIVGVSLSLFTTTSKAQIQQLIGPFIMTMLLNPYPRVRRYTAEHLYVKLVEDGDTLFREHELEQANELILGVSWHDENDPHCHLTNSRNRIADLLSIPLVDKQRNVKIGQKKSSRVAPRDEYESYASLVQDA